MKLRCFSLAFIIFTLGATLCPAGRAQQSETDYSSHFVYRDILVYKYDSKEFCKDYDYWDNDKGHKELIEKTIAARGSLEVDGRRNGGIRIVGGDRSDILVRSCIQAWGKSVDDAKSLVGKVRVSTDHAVNATGDESDSHWSVSYEILVPRNTNLNLKTHNGGISINDVEGNIIFEAINGGISVRNAGGDVRGHTKNGGISVNLTGKGWKGNGLDLETTNGGVNLVVGGDFAGDIESSTVNGGFSSNLRGLTVEKGRWAGGRAYGKVNGGGAKVRVVTTNGGVLIRSHN